MNLESFSIRKVYEKDISKIMDIENQSFEKGIRENEIVFIKRMAIFNDGFLVLVDERDVPLGYISSEIWFYENSINKSYFELGHSIADRHNNNGNELYISSMALSNELKGKGYGHILFDYLIDNIKIYYPNINSSILLVCEHWKNARKIYSNKKFNEIHIIEDFFHPLNGLKGDGIIMRKQI